MLWMGWIKNCNFHTSCNSVCFCMSANWMDAPMHDACKKKTNEWFLLVFRKTFLENAVKSNLRKTYYIIRVFKFTYICNAHSGVKTFPLFPNMLFALIDFACVKESLTSNEFLISIRLFGIRLGSDFSFLLFLCRYCYRSVHTWYFWYILFYLSCISFCRWIMW